MDSSTLSYNQRFSTYEFNKTFISTHNEKIETHTAEFCTTGACGLQSAKIVNHDQDEKMNNQRRGAT